MRKRYFFPMIIFVTTVLGADRTLPVITLKNPVLVIRTFKEVSTGVLEISEDVMTSMLTEGIKEPFQVIYISSTEKVPLYNLFLYGNFSIKGESLKVRAIVKNLEGDSLVLNTPYLNGIDTLKSLLTRFVNKTVDTLKVLPETPAVTKLDGDFLGVSPFKVYPVVFGSHILELNFSGIVVKKSIRFPEEKVLKIESPLKKSEEFGIVEFIGSYNAMIYIKDKKVGETRKDSMLKLKPGDYEIKLVNPIEGTKTVRIHVEAGKKYRISY